MSIIIISMSIIIGHPHENFKDKYETWKMVRNTKPEILMTNLYRDEYGRHGTVDYPKYSRRNIITLSPENSSGKGQDDRFEPYQQAM